MSLLTALAIRPSDHPARSVWRVAACLTKRSAALRHCVLAAAIFGAALVVPFSLAVPAWEVPLPAAAPRAARAPANTAGPAVPVRARSSRLRPSPPRRSRRLGALRLDAARGAGVGWPGFS